MTATLVRRQLARLWADRSLALAVGLGLLGLVVGGGLVWALSQAERMTGDRMRGVVWEEGSGFFALVTTVLAIAAGALQVGGDLRRGTLLSVLARPVSRVRVFLAGWAGTALVLLALEAVRMALAVVAVYGFGGAMDGPGALAMAADLLESLVVLALFAALGAALPVGAAVGAGLLVMLLPGLAYGWPYAAWLRPLSWLLPLQGGQARAIGHALAGSGGDPLRLAEAVAYRACWIAVLLALGSLAFARRDLTPR